MVENRLPVRTEPLCYSPEALEREDREQQREGIPYAHRSAEETLQEVERAGEGFVDRQTAERWATHPDERVSLALLEGDLLLGNYADLRERIAERATLRVREEGILWTGLLDKLSTTGARWPVQGRYVIAGAERRYTPILAPNDLLKDLIPHLRAGPSREELERLRTFGHPLLQALMAHYLPHIDLALIERLFPEPGLRSELISNPGTTPEARARVVADACRLLADAEYGAQVGAAAVVLETAQEREGSLPEEAQAALAQRIRQVLEKGTLRENDRLLERACGVLAAEPVLLPEAREAVYEAGMCELKLTRTVGLLRALATSTHGSPGLWLRILQDNRSGRLKRMLAEHEPARLHPDIRPRLRKADDEVVLRALLEDRGTDLAPVLLRLAELAPAKAAQALEELSEEQLGRFSRREFAQLLASPQAELRLVAMRRWGTRETAEPTPDPPVREGRRRS